MLSSFVARFSRSLFVANLIAANDDDNAKRTLRKSFWTCRQIKTRTEEENTMRSLQLSTQNGLLYSPSQSQFAIMLLLSIFFLSQFVHPFPPFIHSTSPISMAVVNRNRKHCKKSELCVLMYYAHSQFYYYLLINSLAVEVFTRFYHSYNVMAHFFRQEHEVEWKIIARAYVCVY